jgi:hypothetical protein
MGKESVDWGCGDAVTCGEGEDGSSVGCVGLGDSEGNGVGELVSEGVAIGDAKGAGVDEGLGDCVGFDVGVDVGMGVAVGVGVGLGVGNGACTVIALFFMYHKPSLLVTFSVTI